MTKKEKKAIEALAKIRETKELLNKITHSAFKKGLSEDLMIYLTALESLAKSEELLRIRAGLTEGQHLIDGKFVGHDHEED